MNGFLYFLPGHGGPVTPGEIERRGLGHALGGMSVDPCGVSNGPGGAHGTVCAAADSIDRLGFYPAEQTWRRIDESAWVGFFTGSPPGPDDLRRTEMLRGHDVVLADGRRWHAPAARVWVEQHGVMRHASTLPATLKRGENGSWGRGEILPAYRALATIAEAWWDARMAGAERGEFTVADGPNQATAVLAVNYRIGPVEADLLGIWSEPAVVAVLDACIDAPGFAELSKKKAGGG